MNKRIRELAEQAKKYALDAMIKITDKEQALKVYSESYDKKFAELIVRECNEVLRLVPYNSNVEFGDEVIYQDAIKEHFGVEE
jgi:CRISPR/Cas system CMR-associated protein Cmr5 small subunit